MVYQKRSTASLFWRSQGRVCLLLICAGLGLGFLAIKGLKKDSQLASIGIETVGSITNKTRSTRKNGGSSYAVSYSFSTPSDRYTSGTQTVSSEYYGRTEEGDQVPVRYLPTDPTVSETEFGSPAVYELLGVFAAALLMLAGLARGVYLIRRSRGDIWLREHGDVRQSQVTRHDIEDKERKGLKRGRGHWQELSGKEGCSLTCTLPELPPVGTSITIYAHPEGKTRSVWEGDVGSR